MRRACIVGVVTLALLVGAGRARADDKSPHPAPADQGAQEQVQVHPAPHGGTLVPLGDHVGHLEFVLTADGTLTAYVLDAEADLPVRLTQETIDLTITLQDAETSFPVALEGVENVLTGETRGDTSQFEATVYELRATKHFHVVVAYVEYKGMVFKDIAFTFPEGVGEGPGQDLP